LASTTFLGPALLSRAAQAGHPSRLPFSFSRPVVAPPADAPGARPRVLVTGGAGFIASHTVVELVAAGFAVTIVDNLINSSPESVARVRKLVDTPEAITFVRGDVRDEAALGAVLSAAPHAAVIHFAALKAVGESISKPLDYYENNLGGLTTVLAAARAYGIKQVVFSSSATVYGNAAPPFTEATTVGAGITNPYGQTKYIAEIVLRDFVAANPAVAVACLRYFNPVGAHSSGTIGEDPQGIPNNIMPLCVCCARSAQRRAAPQSPTHSHARTRAPSLPCSVQRVAAGKYPKLTIHGNDYATPDGTAQRDYIHVVDLAKGHVKALQWLAKRVEGGLGGMETVNLGTGAAVSVMQLVKAFERASGKSIPYVVGPRRQGDVPAVWADATKARTLLGWTAEKTLDDMCSDSWRWVHQNPDGYSGAPQ
jgi:UDP-glucose 4-epimerase